MTIFVDTDVWMLNDEQLTAGVVEAARMKAQSEERLARLVAASIDRKLDKLAGCTLPTAWVANLTGISRCEASKTVRQGEQLTELVEKTRRVWADGDLTTVRAAIICKTVNALPDRVTVEERHLAEAALLEFAKTFSIDALQRIANHIIEVIDPEGADEHAGDKLKDEEKKSWLRIELSMHNIGEGMTRGRFTLPAVQAGILKSVLEGLASPRRNDLRIFDRDGEHSDAANGTFTHPQKLGRAFCELIEHLSTDAMPQHGGLAASVTINIDFDKLKSGLGTALLSTGDEMSASQARRFACNAHLIPIVLGGDSKALDLGMAKRLYNRYQRIALANRDKGCCWNGCDRPPSWCESHHLQHYGRGGSTDLNNGALFCFYHHHLLHEGEWDARMAIDGTVEVIPPKRVDPQQRPIRHTRFRIGP